MIRNKNLLILISVVLAVVFATVTIRSRSTSIDFNTQVKPILNKRCISCHGGVKQSGELSMMTRADLLKAGESGNTAIIPGDPENSEFYRRLITDDEVERMPYESDGLPEEEIQILKQWIKEGAKWGVHWAYQPIAAVAIPNQKAMGKVGHQSQWGSHPIDYFILDKLKTEQLTPSPRADKATLLRRASLDIIGLPAAEQLKVTYLSNDTPAAFEELVDNLLDSPQFGEKWAAMWLDLARYADTKGSERDMRRSIWEYRDWLIRSFNEDMSYDQFLTEQIAGDLLPNPTDAQYIATGFHRNTTTNDEGGTDNEEFRLVAVVDRVNTTWETLLGTSFACTQCHGHPYDPIKHEEYYQFLAFFNNSRDYDTFADYPWLRKLSEKQNQQLEELQLWISQRGYPEQAQAISNFVKTWQPVYYSLQSDEFVNAENYDTKYLGFRNNGTARLANVDLEGKDYLIFRYSSNVAGGKWSIHLDRPDGEQIATHRINKSTSGWTIDEVNLSRKITGKHDLYFRFANPKLGNTNAVGLSFDWFHFTNPFPAQDHPEYASYKQLFWSLLTAQTDHTLIMVESPVGMQRNTYVWDRGNWMSKMQSVEPDVPKIFNPLPENAPQNRLGLAMWLTDKQNPLTARTMVNRVWEQLMGKGLVETLEDLGTQGIPPTHQELLDYLSYQFMHDYNWSVKRLIREIVLSATYQQSSKVLTETLNKDPQNNWYARANRTRLSAEQIRDQALAVSGLLNPKMYGKAVMPYQPYGVWNTPYNEDQWVMSEGDEIYRRAIYTYIKRGSPHPAFTAFDVNTREVCSSRRINTNTPIQALVTLNDPALMEAAIHLAIKAMSSTTSTEEQISQTYEWAAGKTITVEKTKTLLELFEQLKQDYAQDEAELTELLHRQEQSLQTPTLAALAVVANAILNLDEVITRG